MRAAWMLALVALTACFEGDPQGWVAFNAEDESVAVVVRPEEPTGDAASRTLSSTTGAVEVGTATVTPASGPVGTDHTVVVSVAEEYEEDVGRVTLVTSGDRGENTHLLIQDSADHGLWQVIVTSLGEADEERTDTFTFRLWRAAEEGEEGDTDAGG